MKYTNNRLAFLLGGFLLILPSSTLCTAHAAEAEQWGLWEMSLKGPGNGAPYLDVQLTAAFSQGDHRIVVPGFYDGDGVYKLRFSPPTQGQWQYESRSNRPHSTARAAPS